MHTVDTAVGVKGKVVLAPLYNATTSPVFAVIGESRENDNTALVVYCRPVSMDRAAFLSCPPPADESSVSVPVILCGAVGSIDHPRVVQDIGKCEGDFMGAERVIARLLLRLARNG